MDNGWIKLHRKLAEWQWYQDSHTLHLFLHLLLHANHQPKKWRKIIVERGQIITGLYKLEEYTGISIQSLRTSLARLKSTNEITSKSTNQFTIITICNYNQYQDDEREINKQINKQTNKQLTNEQQTTNNKQECNNDNNKNKDKILSSRTKTKISDQDFIKALKENIAYRGIDIDKELAKMDMWLLIPKNQHRKKTHRFILNWINKSEREIKTEGGGNKHGTTSTGITPAYPNKYDGVGKIPNTRLDGNTKKIS